MNIEIQFKDHTKQNFPKDITPQKIIHQNFNHIKEPVAVVFNNQLLSLNTPLIQNGTLEIVTSKDKENLKILNEVISYLMVQAVLKIYPQALLVKNTESEEGFGYDIDFQDISFSEKNLFEIENIMHQLLETKTEIIIKKINIDQAKNLFSNNKYKKILLEETKKKIITIYNQGNFFDICSKAKIIDFKIMKYFKLLKISSSYFKNNFLTKTLTRISGISFFNQKDLKKYFTVLKEKKEKDHKNINKQQNYFMLSSDVGLGLPFWLPKGATIRRIIETYIVDKEINHDYRHVYTPILANIKLYEESGHLEMYKENMFPIMYLPNQEKLVLRPMNCPHHMMIFKQKLRSYKELPLKIAELGMMHRYEHSGAVSGLQRTREMTLNDAHIFITEEQIKTEFIKIIDLILEIYADFNIKNYFFNLSTRDKTNKKKYFNNDSMWEKSEFILRKILKDLNLSYKEGVGDAAFYGPKLDIQVLTALGNEQTLSTIQLDFLLPQRFNLTYINKDGKGDYPIVIHRAIISTLERFVAFLIEQNKGVFPLWLAPIQIILIPINNNIHLEYVIKIKQIMHKNNFRVILNDKELSLGYKIREAQKNKVPYQVVIGDQEIKNNTITFRKYQSKQQETTSIEKFIQSLKTIIKNKK